MGQPHCGVSVYFYCGDRGCHLIDDGVGLTVDLSLMLESPVL